MQKTPGYLRPGLLTGLQTRSGANYITTPAAAFIDPLPVAAGDFWDLTRDAAQ
jgi:hypothetical protein